jgi:hypothetical protein
VLWDPYAYPYRVDGPQPRAAHRVTLNGSVEYATAPGGTRKRSDGALKNRWGKPRFGFESRARHVAAQAMSRSRGCAAHDVVRRRPVSRAAGADPPAQRWRR